MFQYASTMGLAHISNRTAAFPISGIIHEYDLTCFNIPFNVLTYSDPSFIKHVYEEDDFKYKESLSNLPDNTTIQGYLQSEKYFLPIEDIIRRHFTFKQEIFEKAENILKSLIDERGRIIVSVHFRRTDYNDIQDVLPIIPFAYYRKTISLMRAHLDNPIFLIFSDDIAWCENNIVGEDVMFSKDNEPAVDMCIMSLCDHHIIANSSFSWWGAWLKNGDEQVVYAPTPWFGPRGFQDTQDLIPDRWSLVNYKNL
jgi:hypothetical protein